jgi:hypothetical protein
MGGASPLSNLCTLCVLCGKQFPPSAFSLQSRVGMEGPTPAGLSSPRRYAAEPNGCATQLRGRPQWLPLLAAGDGAPGLASAVSGTAARPRFEAPPCPAPPHARTAGYSESVTWCRFRKDDLTHSPAKHCGVCNGIHRLLRHDENPSCWYGVDARPRTAAPPDGRWLTTQTPTRQSFRI